MRISIWRFICLLTVLALFASPFFNGNVSSAAEPDQDSISLKPGMRLVAADYVGRSQELRTLAPRPIDPNAPSILRSLQERLVLPKTQQETSGIADASIVQRAALGATMPAPIANFEGVGNVSGVLPPDTQGDIGYDPATGKKYYVQWVNLAFQIWDVTDPSLPVSLYGPAAGNTLWSGTGTICDLNNDGDPITLFDPLAKRWMMSQFALGFPNNFHQCIAVSASADPTGTWYLYDFLTSTTVMNDYPKFGVWPDGYYMTVNQFDGNSYAWEGAGVAVFQRDAMLNGQPANMIYLDLGAVTKNYGGMLPSDLDGAAPVIGAPNIFMEWDDSSWLGDPQDTLRLWEFHTDWANPANTTFGANINYDPNLMLSTSNQDPDMCGMARSCIPQPGTPAGLDAISDRLMYRLQYRTFGEYQTLVTNHTVDVDGTDWAGVHWFELRNTGSGWSVFQEGVYAPDSDHRWMGSVAMDDSGNIGLGYSVSSGTTYPSIRYTGRLAADPPGMLPQGEASLIAGSGSQTHTAARWGDYSMMAVDPSDGCTFWYTTEYVETTGLATWQTRIGSFKFPSCTNLPTGTLTGMVTDGTNPLAAAAVEASGGYATITNNTGEYTLLLPVGEYIVTASKYGYEPDQVSMIIINEDTTTTQDFILPPGQTFEVSGKVTDSVAGWPLYARIDIFGYPYGPVFTDPSNGEYSVQLVEGPYDFTVTAMAGGYEEAHAPVVVSGAMVQNFALDPDLIACTAPGYHLLPPVIRQDFETWPLTDWTVINSIPGGLAWNSSTVYNDGNYTGGAGMAAAVNSDHNKNVEYDTGLVTPPINGASLPGKILVYKANYQDFSLYERLDLDITTNGGVHWTNLLSWSEDHGSMDSSVGERVEVDLSAYASSTFQLRWRYYTSQIDPWDWYAQIDEIELGASCEPIPGTGLVTGAVYDANTALPLANPLVYNTALEPALLIDTSDDPGQPNPIYLTAAPAGPYDLTAEANGYAASTETPLVIAGDVVQQDFALEAGALQTDPGSLDFLTTNIIPQQTKPLEVSNVGGAVAEFNIFAISGVWAPPSPLGPFAANTRHTGPKNLMDRDASNLRVNMTPLGVSQLDAGSLSLSWDTGLVLPWGIGFNLDASDLWLGNLAAGGGDDLNYRFEPDGTDTGDTIDTAPWVDVFAADMTYNPFTGKLWQVNVGGNNCIYEMDPVAKVATGKKLCPAFGTSQRGLAFDPLSNTYYSGSWLDGILNHFDANGVLLDSMAVNLSISGLAFNPSTGHLFVMTNHLATDGTYDVYVLDTNNNYANLGGFNLMNGAVKAFADYAQAGLELDCSGNLWAVDQKALKVYVADSGETGVCDWQAEWLSIEPALGAVVAGGSQQIDVTANGSGMTPGEYQAYLRLVGDTPYADLIVPVTLNVINAIPVYMPIIRK